MKTKTIDLECKIQSGGKVVSAKIKASVRPVPRVASEEGPRGPWSIHWEVDLIPSADSVPVAGTLMALGCKPTTIRGTCSSVGEARTEIDKAIHKLACMWNEHAFHDAGQLAYINLVVEACNNFFPEQEP